jgi:hypothetical protein
MRPLFPKKSSPSMKLIVPSDVKEPPGPSAAARPAAKLRKTYNFRL